MQCSKPDVELDTVSKRFGPVDALTDLSLRLERRRITVLLGPNGAGKTTATRIITGALAPDTGTSTVFGVDPAGPDGEEVRRQCGVVSAKPSLYERMSGLDNLRYAAELYGLGRGDAAARRIAEAADQFGIGHALQQKVGGYSTGMVTRLALARAILHRPRLLLLDEPTSGLDPESAQSVLTMVREMTASDRTVLMCTHLLPEAEGLADQVVILDGGSTLISGEPSDLANRYWPNRQVRIEAEHGPDLDRMVHWVGVIAYDRRESTATVELNPSMAPADLIAGLVADGVRIVAVEPFRASLEDLYFAVRRGRTPAITDQEPIRARTNA